jgi:DtxR family Mn-dependent transcriptional regulator
MSSGFHPSVEQYLETLYDLSEDGETIIQARLAERLKHSAPTVSAVVKKLIGDGDVIKIGRNIQLTEKGLKRAQSVVRKHRLAERLLTDVLGIEWHLVHEEAGLLEHVISDRVEQKILEITGNPTTCPHGNPIPGSQSVNTTGEFRLLSCEARKTYKISRIGEVLESDTEILALLYSFGITPGKNILIKSINFEATHLQDSGLTIQTSKGINTIGVKIAEQLWVT